MGTISALSIRTYKLIFLKEETFMVAPTSASKDCSEQFSPLSLPEIPRMFGANGNAEESSLQPSTEKDFAARWWPGDLETWTPPRKPR
jgi:hypothetical protein